MQRHAALRADSELSAGRMRFGFVDGESEPDSVMWQRDEWQDDADVVGFVGRDEC